MCKKRQQEFFLHCMHLYSLQCSPMHIYSEASLAEFNGARLLVRRMQDCGFMDHSELPRDLFHYIPHAIPGAREMGQTRLTFPATT